MVPTDSIAHLLLFTISLTTVDFCTTNQVNYGLHKLTYVSYFKQKSTHENVHWILKLNFKLRFGISIEKIRNLHITVLTKFG